MIVRQGHNIQSDTLLLQELSLLQRVSQVLSSIAQEHDAPLAVAPLPPPAGDRGAGPFARRLALERLSRRGEVSAAVGGMG